MNNKPFKPYRQAPQTMEDLARERGAEAYKAGRDGINANPFAVAILIKAWRAGWEAARDKALNERAGLL